VPPVQDDAHADADPPTRRSRRLAVATLVGANGLMLLGVLLLGWDAGTVLMTYWAETGVIAVWVLAGVIHREGIAGVIGAVVVTVHLGIFMGVHYVFLNVFVGGGGLSRIAIWALAGLMISRGIESWSRRDVDRHLKLMDLLKPVYARVIVMQLTIIAGGFLIVWLGSPIGLLALLVVVKTGLDLAMTNDRGLTRRGAAS
jgi:hypothetical protein